MIWSDVKVGELYRFRDVSDRNGASCPRCNKYITTRSWVVKLPKPEALTSRLTPRPDGKTYPGKRWLVHANCWALYPHSLADAQK